LANKGSRRDCATHFDPFSGEGSDMKANLKTTILPLLTAAISCTLSLAAGASDNDRQFSSNFSPIVDAVRKAVNNLTKDELATYGTVLKTPCVTGPDFGAMGVHLINHNFVDGELDPNKPEALIFEPQPDGSKRIVGVEYIVPKAAWDAAHPATPPLPDPRPSLFGHLLNFVDTPNRYGIEGGFFEIHVWAFEDNPRGALHDWNPDVTCEKQPIPRS
jgi:hypothetical protein